MSIADELAKLADLRERGALTESEFTRAKFQILNREAAAPPPPAAPPPATDPIRHHLYELGRSIHDRVFGGVCGGLAKQTALPSWLWRAAFCICMLCYGVGFVVYLVLWACMPSEREDECVSDATFR